MAQRRMFSKSITNSSRFLMMPQSAQNLYFHLGMNADDDGFCEHFTIMRMTESKPDDLKILQVKGFIHIFDDKILIITEWKENNYIQKDRYSPSKYLEIYKNEVKQLSEGKSDVYKMDTQVRLGKVRLDKDIYTDNKVVGEDASNVEILTDYFISIKGSATKRKARYFKAAKELLGLCDNDILRAKTKLDNLKTWAENNGLEYEMETAIKRYLEL